MDGVYDHVHHIWRNTVFPAARPSGRRDTLLLDAWVDSEVERVTSETATLDLTESPLVFAVVALM
jgi:hypothetical protein